MAANSAGIAMNINFTTKQEQYIASQFRLGDYQNASEVVRDALRLHEIYRRRVIEELCAEMAESTEKVFTPQAVVRK